MSSVSNVVEDATEVAVADAKLKPRISGDALALAGKARQFLEQAKTYTITPGDADSYTRATELFKVIGTAGRQLDEIRLAHTRPIDAMKSAVMDFFRSPAANVADAKKLLDKKIRMEDARIETERLAEEARLRAAQRAEEERARVEAERLRAEAERVEREAAVRAVDADSGSINELALEEARELREAAEMAEAAAETAMAPVALAPAPRKAAGVSKRVNYSAEVADLRVLVQAWLDGKVPAPTIIADQKYLDGQARLNKDAFAMPGVKLLKSEKLGG